MSEDKKLEKEKDTSQPGREEEVISNRDPKTTEQSPLSDKENETEGEKRFKEGLANNSDTKDS